MRFNHTDERNQPILPENGKTPSVTKEGSLSHAIFRPYSATALFSCLARRAFFRLAAFLWITPLDAALSITAEVADSCSVAFFASAATAASNFLMEVRIPLFTIRLRRFFFSLTLTRFLADWMFGNSVHLPLGSLKNHRMK